MHYNNTKAQQKFDRIEPSLITSGQTKATSSRNHHNGSIKQQDSINSIFMDTKQGDTTPANIRYSSNATPMNNADLSDLRSRLKPLNFEAHRNSAQYNLGRN